MAGLSPSTPPKLGPNAKYGDYKGWLLENFYLELCSYCLEQYGALTIDHYVPQSLDASLTHDPSNLLLACTNCQRRKSDYHPAHTKRRTRPRDDTGFMVLDVRADDLAAMFALEADGELHVRRGQLATRAVWNAQLLRLDLYAEKRTRILHKVGVAEGLLAALPTAQEPLKTRAADALAVIIDDLAQRMPFLRAFDVPVSADLGAVLVAAGR